ncbi:MAG: invasion associated locus B family protein [Pseudomonadota bacterium]
MKHLIGTTILAVALALPSLTWAQDTTDEPEPAEEAGSPTEEEAAPEESSPPGLSLGVEENERGRIFVKETFGDWQLRCVLNSADAEVCQLYQLMQDGEGNSVAEINLFPLPEGQQAVAGANIVTPLETLLTASLRLAVDGGQAKRYPYSFCSQAGCFSRIGLTAEEIASFRQGASARVTIVPAASPNATVELSLSLNGFTAGYNALVASEAARQSGE